MCTLRGGWSQQFTLMLFESVVFLEGAHLQTHLRVLRFFHCLSILTIDFAPNCFDYCDVIDNKIAIMSRTSIHISIKMADGQVS
jgi:hypothetical protein